MTFVDLTRDDAEDLIAGNLHSDRADLAPVRDLTVFMRATGELEPAPPMTPDLILEIGSPTTN